MPVVEAVGFAVGHDDTANGLARAKYIEAYVTRAIRHAQNCGITDAEEMRARILQARDAAIENLGCP